MDNKERLERLQNIIVWPAIDMGMRDVCRLKYDEIGYVEAIENHKWGSFAMQKETQPFYVAQQRGGFSKREGASKVAQEPAAFLRHGAVVEGIYGSPSISEKEYEVLQSFRRSSEKNYYHQFKDSYIKNAGSGIGARNIQDQEGYQSSDFNSKSNLVALFDAAEAGFFEDLPTLHDISVNDRLGYWYL